MNVIFQNIDLYEESINDNIEYTETQKNKYEMYIKNKLQNVFDKNTIKEIVEECLFFCNNYIFALNEFDIKNVMVSATYFVSIKHEKNIELRSIFSLFDFENLECLKLQEIVTKYYNFMLFTDKDKNNYSYYDVASLNFAKKSP